MRGKVIVKIGNSTEDFHLSAAFRNPALARNDHPLRVEPADIWWTVQTKDNPPIYGNNTEQGFEHTIRIKKDILVSSLKIVQKRDNHIFFLKTKHNEEITFVIETNEDYEKFEEKISAEITPGTEDSDELKAKCRAEEVSMAVEINWMLDGEPFPHEILSTIFVGRRPTHLHTYPHLHHTYTLIQEIKMPSETQPDKNKLICEVSRWDNYKMISSPAKIKPDQDKEDLNDKVTNILYCSAQNFLWI